MQAALSLWEHSLQATRSALVPAKSFWYLINFWWHGSQWLILGCTVDSLSFCHCVSSLSSNFLSIILFPLFSTVILLILCHSDNSLSSCWPSIILLILCHPSCHVSSLLLSLSFSCVILLYPLSCFLCHPVSYQFSVFPIVLLSPLFLFVHFPVLSNWLHCPINSLSSTVIMFPRCCHVSSLSLCFVSVILFPLWCCLFLSVIIFPLCHPFLFVVLFHPAS